MEYLFIYLLQICKSIDFIQGIIGIIIIFLAVITVALYMSKSDCDEAEECFITIKKMLINVVAIFLLLLLVPSQRTMCLLGGVYYGKKVVSNITDSKKIEKVNTIIDLQLDKYIKELKAGNNDR